MQCAANFIFKLGRFAVYCNFLNDRLLKKHTNASATGSGGNASPRRRKRETLMAKNSVLKAIIECF